MADIKEYNEMIDDGVQNLRITVKAVNGSGTKEAFQKIKNHLCALLPGLEGNIQWEDFEVPMTAKVIVEAAKFVFIFAILLTTIPFSQPLLVTISDSVKQNKYKILIMCYLSFVVVTNSFSTGVFDLFIGEKLVFSKTTKYRYPTPDDAERLLRDYMRDKQSKKLESKKEE